MTRAPGRLAALLALSTGCSVPGFLLPTDELLRDVYVRGSASSPSVALTFDDGPNGRCTEAVLDALAASKTPATFFVLGANVADGRNDELLARMVREGHMIGLHSYGFMDAAFKWLMAFIASQIFIIALGLVPLPLWASFRSRVAAPNAADARAAKPAPAAT